MRTAIRKSRRPAGKPVKKLTDFFGGLHARNALGKLGSADQSSRILQRIFFAHAEFEESAQGCKLARHRWFLQVVVEKPAHEFANDDVVHLMQRQGRLTRRREKSFEQLNIAG